MGKDYGHFLGEIKTQILQSKHKAAAAVNKELILLYFQIGAGLSQKIEQAQWGSKVVQQLSTAQLKDQPFCPSSIVQLQAIHNQDESNVEFVPLVTATFQNIDNFLNKVFFR